MTQYRTIPTLLLSIAALVSAGWFIAASAAPQSIYVHPGRPEAPLVHHAHTHLHGPALLLQPGVAE